MAKIIVDGTMITGKERAVILPSSWLKASVPVGLFKMMMASNDLQAADALFKLLGDKKEKEGVYLFEKSNPSAFLARAPPVLPL